MSTRPKRTPKPITRLQNLQANNAVVRRRTRKSGTVASTPPPVSRVNIPKTNKTLRGRIFHVYNSLMKSGEIKDANVFNFLLSYYVDAEETFLTREFSSKTDDFIRTMLKTQYNIMVRNKRVNSGTITLSFTFNDVQLKDFVLMMYLDVYHDGKDKEGGFRGTLTEFINGGIPSYIVGEKKSELIGNTPLKDSLIENGIFDLKTDKPKGSHEKKIKHKIYEIFNTNKQFVYNQGVNLSRYARDREHKPIYMSIDAESKNTHPFSILMAKSSFINTRNEATRRKFLKSIISIANRVDPGNLMPLGGASEEYSRLFNPSEMRSTQLYDFSDYVFKIHNSTFKLSNKVGQPAVAKTKPFTLTKVNSPNNNIPVGGSASNAARGNNKDKVSKFLGDFFQILVSTKYPNRYVCTQDGMCAAMTAFIFKNIKKQEPRLFLDVAYTQGNKIHVFGAEDRLLETSVYNNNKTNIRTGNNAKRGNNKSVSGVSVTSNNSMNSTANSIGSNNKPNTPRTYVKRKRNNMNSNNINNRNRVVKRQALEKVPNRPNSKINANTKVIINTWSKRKRNNMNSNNINNKNRVVKKQKTNTKTGTGNNRTEINKLRSQLANKNAQLAKQRANRNAQIAKEKRILAEKKRLGIRNNNNAGVSTRSKR